MVSSRKCDVNFKVPDYYKATVFGEVVGIERLPGGDVRVGTLSTFSINQTSEHMYTRPEAIIEQVKTCYAKAIDILFMCACAIQQYAAYL